MNGTLDGKKWCPFGKFVCYLVSHCTKGVQTQWQNLSLLFSSSLRKEGCGCCQSASFSAEKHFPLNLSRELFSGIHSCLENRQGTLRKLFKMFNFNLSLVSVLYLATRFELIFKKFSIYRPLATVCIDFHLREMSQDACMWWRWHWPVSSLERQLMRWQGVGSRSNIDSTNLLCCYCCFFCFVLFYQHKPLHLLFRVIFTLSTVVKTLKIIRTVKHNEYLKNPHLEEKLTF